MDADTLSHKQVILRCEGLDTLATIRINGRELGQTDNIFRTWEFDAKPLLQTGENKIEILISSPAKFVEALEKKRGWPPQQVLGFFRTAFLKPNEFKIPGSALVKHGSSEL